jgi:hypothetical protein
MRKSVLRRYRTKPSVKPRVTLLPGGHAAISGVNYRDLRDLLVMAQLQSFETRAQQRRENESDPDSLRWAAHIHGLIEKLLRAMDEQITKTNGGSRPDTRSLKERLRERDKERKLLDMILAEALASREGS